MFQLGKVYGIESYVLSPAQTKELYPLMNVKDLYGTLYVPKDGTMDPAGTCTTLSRAATARGATVLRYYSAQLQHFILHSKLLLIFTNLSSESFFFRSVIKVCFYL